MPATSCSNRTRRTNFKSKPSKSFLHRHQQQSVTPPDTHAMTSINQTSQYPPAQGEVLVVMRYKREMDRRIRNSIIRMKGRIRQPGTEGRCLGLADKVYVLESAPFSDWAARDDWCIALFLFPSEEKARRWYFSEPELKQHDFLPPSDGVQLFALHLRYLPKPGRLTFHWLEMHNVRDKSCLQYEYVDKTAAMLDAEKVNHGIIFVQDPGSPSQLYRLKDSWIPHNAESYCVVNVFESEEQFQHMLQREQSAELQARRAEVCDAVSLVFTVDPDITGPPSKA